MTANKIDWKFVLTGTLASTLSIAFLAVFSSIAVGVSLIFGLVLMAGAVAKKFYFAYRESTYNQSKWDQLFRVLYICTAVGFLTWQISLISPILALIGFLLMTLSVVYEVSKDYSRYEAGL